MGIAKREKRAYSITGRPFTVGEVYEAKQQLVDEHVCVENTVVRILDIATNFKGNDSLLIFTVVQLTDYDGYQPMHSPSYPNHYMSVSEFDMNFTLYNQGQCRYTVYEYLRSKNLETRNSIGVVNGGSRP